MNIFAAFILAASLLGSPTGWIDVGYVPQHNEPIILQIGKVEKYWLEVGARLDKGPFYIQMSEVFRYGGQWPEQTWEHFKMIGYERTQERHYEFGYDLGNGWLIYSEHKDPTKGATWNISTDYYWRLHVRREFG